MLAVLNSWHIKYVYSNWHIPLCHRFLESAIKKSPNPVLFSLIYTYKTGRWCALSRSSCCGYFGLLSENNVKYCWDVYMLYCTPWKRQLSGIMLQSTLGIASRFKMYHVFQNFPNGQFTQLIGGWLILVNAFTL